MVPPTESQPIGPASRRRWRLFLAVEGVLLLTAIVGLWTAGTLGIPATWLLGILWTWLAFTLPIGVLYLIGHLPVMTLSPLLPSAESRAFRQELKCRPAWTDEEFYDRFYAGSGIPRDIPARIRRCLMEFDRLAERVVPTDRLPLLPIIEELDYADVLESVGEELGVALAEADYPAVDGTLDNLIRLVHARRERMPT